MIQSQVQRRRQLIAIVRRQFRLQWLGIHGVPHWGRVRWNGLAMARVNGARADVVELFAFLHDSQRFHDGTTATDCSRPTSPSRPAGMRIGSISVALERRPGWRSCARRRRGIRYCAS